MGHPRPTHAAAGWVCWAAGWGWGGVGWGVWAAWALRAGGRARLAGSKHGGVTPRACLLHAHLYPRPLGCTHPHPQGAAGWWLIGCLSVQAWAPRLAHSPCSPPPPTPPPLPACPPACRCTHRTAARHRRPGPGRAPSDHQGAHTLMVTLNYPELYHVPTLPSLAGPPCCPPLDPQRRASTHPITRRRPLRGGGWGGAGPPASAPSP